MSLDKSIEHGKEKRKPYYGDKKIDATCRNHGTDKCSIKNRTYSSYKKELEALDKINEVQ